MFFFMIEVCVYQDYAINKLSPIHFCDVSSCRAWAKNMMNNLFYTVIFVYLKYLLKNNIVNNTYNIIY